MKISELFPEEIDSYIDESKNIFYNIYNYCKNKRGYIFGTGPSLSSVMNRDFSDGVTIACNSMVRNKELLDILKPRLIVAADPIFHAGVSTYAAAFRKNLIESLDKYDSYLIVPLRDYHIYITYMPERFRNRIAAIPYQTKSDPNLNLIENYYVTSTGNVLTLFLLPLSCTFFEEIFIAGCDGRPLEEDNYFWRHDKASQFNDQMDEIKKAHPAFFDIDYNDYYIEHCSVLEKWIERAEEENKNIINITPSYIPALRDRFVDYYDKGSDKISELIILDPDALDYFGHFLAMDDKLSDACKEYDLKFTVFGNVNCAEEVLEERDFFEPVFSVHSWTIGNRPKGPAESDVKKFASELKKALSLRKERGIKRNAVIYMYCGSLPVAKIARDVLREFDNVTAVICLFWLSFIDYKNSEYVKQWKSFVEKCGAESKVFLAAPTQRLAENFKKLYGVEIPVLPHPSTTFSDKEVIEIIENKNLEKNPSKKDRLRILFPGGAREEKGFLLTVDFAPRLADRFKDKMEVVVRSYVTKGTPPNVRREIPKLKNSRCVLVENHMDDYSFKKFLESGDIIVLPYKSPDFSERTSGLLIDAIYLRKPVVVWEDTWLSDIVRKYNNGVIVKGKGYEEFEKAILDLIHQYDAVTSNIGDVQKEYFSLHSWSSLVNSIVKIVGGETEIKDVHLLGEEIAFRNITIESKPARAVVIPPLEHERQLHDLIARAAWYVPPMGLERLDILVSDEALVNAPWEVSERFDPALKARLERLKPIVRIQHASKQKDIEKLVEQADMVFFREEEAYEFWRSTSRLNAMLSGKRLWRVDPVRTRGESSNYLQAGFFLVSNKEKLARAHHLKFKELLEKIGRKKRAFVLATGPSSAAYRAINFENSFKVVCNSAIKDDALMAHVRPDVVVFADPIFHFGPSRYAGEFRRSLLKAAERHDFTIIIPMRYYGQFIDALPELKDRTIAVPFEYDFGVNLDLEKEFGTQATDNILTLLMVPLATTFAREVYFIGCDGRCGEEGETFWRHGKAVQFNDEMDNIRLVHPGFFNIDYNDYYEQHCKTLERYLRMGESQGKSFHSLTHSCIPALAERQAFSARNMKGPDKLRRMKELLITRRIVLIDPDIHIRVGHFPAYREKIREIAKTLGMPVDLICGVNATEDDLEGFDNAMPVLTVPSHVLGNDMTGEHELKATAELEAALDIYAGKVGDEDYAVYMYCGALEYLETFVEFLKHHEKVSAHVNLFYEAVHAGRQKRNSNPSRARKILEECVALSPRLMLTLPSEEAADEVARQIGVRLPVAVNPSTTFDALRNVVIPRGGNGASGLAGKRLRVLMPMLPSAEKGYGHGLELAKVLADEGFTPVIRYVEERDPKGIWKDEVASLRGRAEVLEGFLEPGAFRNMLKKSDVVILPYDAEKFRARPSGLLADALLAAKPVITLKESWLGNRVEKYDCGVVLNSPSPDAVLKALMDIRRNYGYYAQMARRAGEDYLRSNSWADLVRSILMTDKLPEVTASGEGPAE